MKATLRSRIFLVGAGYALIPASLALPSIGGPRGMPGHQTPRDPVHEKGSKCTGR